MSLVGSLEDLGLGDILQIISLSRKSGILELRGESAEGQIVFSEGAISSAYSSGGPMNLGELLGRARSLAGPPIDEAIRQARREERDLEAVVIEQGIVSAQDLDSLRREHVENTVLRMFTWPTGEFSFEICDRPADAAGDLGVSPGVNPQFLALEGTRVTDECARAGEDEGIEDEEDDVAGLDLDAAFGPDAAFASSSTASSDASAEALSESAEPEAEPVLAPAAVVEMDPIIEPEPVIEASSVIEPGQAIEPLPVIEPEPVGEPEPIIEPAAAMEPEPVIDAPPVVPVEVPAPAAVEPASAPPPVEAEPPEPLAAPTTPPPPVVVIDPDITCLEWIKAALDGAVPTVHVFQRTDHGMNRIRQYLARAQCPLVVLASDAPADALSGARTVAEMVKRLKGQAKRMPILLLGDEGDGESAPVKGADGVVFKPTRTQLADPRHVQEREAMAERLREQMRELGVASGWSLSAPDTPQDLPKETLARLKVATDRLRARAASGETLSIVMEFALETFSRVALFVLSGDEVHGIAQLGLAEAGGPDDEGLRKLQLPARESAWFRAVLDSRKPVRRGASDPGDQRLAVLLGNAVPEEAWVAPIESGDQVVALLYGDNLPGRELIGDTAALEVVLQQAGLVLDLACLDRILQQSEGV